MISTSAVRHKQYHCTVANATINGIQANVIVDTGAGMSIIGGGYYDTYLRDQDVSFVSWKNDFNAQAANGQAMKIRGDCTVMLSLGGRKELHNFRVIDDVGHNILLGTDSSKFGKLTV